MRKGYAHIEVVLDRSGSMVSILEDTIGGFNSFLKEQKEAEGSATLSLNQFDNEFDTVYSFVEVKAVKDLNYDTFRPRGSTALYDAIGKTITETGRKLHEMRETSRPEKVVILIITDGEENASREYTSEKVKEMIEHQTNVYGWQFMFIGANQDAILTAQTFGIAQGRALSYTANAQGSAFLYSSLSKNVADFRSAQGSLESLNFTEEDRKKQEDAK